MGIRAGEKLHEEMISQHDSINTIEYNKYFVIAPNSKFINWGKREYMKHNKGGKNCPNYFSYNSESNKKFFKISELKK